jgi:hypothetical protein
MFRRAGHFANEAGRVLEEFATAFRESDSRGRVGAGSGSPGPGAAGTASSAASNVGSVDPASIPPPESLHRRRRAVDPQEAPRPQRPVSSSLPPPRVSRPSRHGHAHGDPSRGMRHAHPHASRGTLLGEPQWRPQVNVSRPPRAARLH